MTAQGELSLKYLLDIYTVYKYNLKNIYKTIAKSTNSTGTRTRCAGLTTLTPCIVALHI